MTASGANSLPRSSLLARVSMATRNGCFDNAPTPVIRLASAGVVPRAGRSICKLRRWRNWERDIRRHAPSILRANPIQDHQKRFWDRDLSAIGNRDADRHIGLGDVVAQRDDLLLVVVGHDAEWTGLVEIVEMLQHDLGAPKTRP